MPVKEEQSKSNFKQLLSYFLIEKILICAPDPKKLCSSSWRIVEDIDAPEQVNWAIVIFDNICDSLCNLKHLMHESGQHYFKGCAPILEVIIPV